VRGEVDDGHGTGTACAYSALDLEKALRTISSLVERSEKARRVFPEGTPQHTLQRNRVDALCVASSLIAGELGGDRRMDGLDGKVIEKAVVQIGSLISKSEKARTKVGIGTWQRAMLDENIDALHIALSLLTEAQQNQNGE